MGLYAKPCVRVNRMVAVLMNKPNKSAEEVLEAYRNYVIESITLKPTNVKHRKLNRSQALTQLTTDIEELIGEDEVKSVDPVHSGVAQRTRNEFRAELRKKLKAYLNGGK